MALAPLPLVNVAGRRFSEAIHPAVLAVQAEQADLATVVEETVGGVRVIKGFGAESVQAAKLRKEADDIQRESIKAARIRAKYLPAIDLLPQLGLIAVLGLGGMQVINGDLTLGQLVQFNFYVALLVRPLRMLGMTIAWGQRAAVALQRVNEVLEIHPDVVDPDAPGRPAARRPCQWNRVGAVGFDDVDFGYDPTVPVLRRVRPASSRPGESVAIVGATGSGKSTVARLLVRFYDVGRRQRHDRRHRRPRPHRCTTSGVPSASCSRTRCCSTTRVAANIAFADPEATTEQIERAARLAGAHDFIMGLPDAYDTVLGERGFSLSGGQRQRIAIARAILADPRVLVLDDATSAVDPSKEHEIRAAMATVMEGRTTIVIAHRPGTIALADTVVLLDDGQGRRLGHARASCSSTNRATGTVLAAMETAPEVAESPIDQPGSTSPDRREATPDVPDGRRHRGRPARLGREPKQVLRRTATMAVPFRRTIDRRGARSRRCRRSGSSSARCSSATASTTASTPSDSGVLRNAVIAYLVVVAGAYFASRQQYVLINRAGEGFLPRLRVRVFDHIQRQSLAFFDRNKSGVLIARMTADVESMGELVQFGLLQLVVGGDADRVLARPAVRRCRGSSRSSGCSSCPIIVVASRKFQRDSNEAYLDVRENVGQNLSTLQEGIAGVRVIQAYAREPEQTRRFVAVEPHPVRLARAQRRACRRGTSVWSRRAASSPRRS